MHSHRIEPVILCLGGFAISAVSFWGYFFGRPLLFALILGIVFFVLSCFLIRPAFLQPDTFYDEAERKEQEWIQSHPILASLLGLGALIAGLYGTGYRLIEWWF